MENNFSKIIGNQYICYIYVITAIKSLWNTGQKPGKSQLT